ncbi:MAG TPA: M14 family zinc carboxypeptidase [Cerasibacillus sp.]|uniref:M14 family zinc carboxypeptidase n=1 Tax=Cerasibacillus sp. TaxID=2498711 RepID=UPI002F42A470
MDLNLIRKIVDQVPEYDSFLTVDELDESTWQLANEYPDVVEVFEAGRSRKGHPILCSKIGDGEKNALCFALPHPNEPIGAMMIEYLSRALAENEGFRKATGYTWYFMKCVDPDGTRLNEKWFKGPFNVYNYTKNFFRPGSIEQVEWTFPIEYKNLKFNDPMPETEAIMKVIRETKPEFLYSLHNAGFGGAYWYITHEFEDIYDELREAALRQGVSLHLGEPESPAVEEFSPSIYRMLGIEEEYDYLERFTDVNPAEHIDCGTSSNGYASQYNDCVTILTELPYFFDKKIEDLSESDMTRREAILKNIEFSVKHYTAMDQLLEQIRPYLTKGNPFPLLVEQMIENSQSSAQAKKKWSEQEEFARKATVSEVFDNLVVARFYNGLSIGLVMRTAEFEMEKLKEQGDYDKEVMEKLANVQKEASRRLKENSDWLEENMDYEVIPIQKLVKIQVECGLIVANRKLKG